MASKRRLSACAILIATSAMLWSCDSPGVLDPGDPRSPAGMPRAVSGRIDLDEDHFLFWSISDAALQQTIFETVTRAECTWGQTNVVVQSYVYLPILAVNITNLEHSVVHTGVWSKLAEMSGIPAPETVTIAAGHFERVRQFVVSRDYAGTLKVWKYILVNGTWTTTAAPTGTYPITYRLFERGAAPFKEACHDQGGGG
jgi:hypothetical protein